MKKDTKLFYQVNSLEPFDISLLFCVATATSTCLFSHPLPSGSQRHSYPPGPGLLFLLLTLLS